MGHIQFAMNRSLLLVVVALAFVLCVTQAASTNEILKNRLMVDDFDSRKFPQNGLQEFMATMNTAIADY
ncbi:hypothetical protein B566_EDAN005524, partial [Ephemera danica]